MSALIPFVAMDQPCTKVQNWVNQQLTGAGLHAVQTFDLQVARLAHTDCACPHHGTAECNCQMVVLLIYLEKGDPVTLVIHGQDNRTWLSLASPTGQRTNPHLEVIVRRILTPRTPNALLPTEVAYEAQSAT